MVLKTSFETEHTLFVCCSIGKQVQVLVVNKESLELNKVDVVSQRELDCTSADLVGEENNAEDINYQTLVGCGNNKEFVDIIIVDHENSVCIVEDGIVGEIWISSHSKAMGYWRLNELSKHDFHAILY